MKPINSIHNYIVLTAILLPLSIGVSCSQPVKDEPESAFPRQVGDILFDPALDDPTFTICDSASVAQYYSFFDGLQYEGEKTVVVDHFLSQYNPDPYRTESGFLSIRFLVNCQGVAGRYRVYSQVDEHLNPKQFSTALSEELMRLTKALDGWLVASYEGEPWDYYQYLTFKLEEGKITEITP